MTNTIELHGITLTPVVELEPGDFSTQSHPSPAGSMDDTPEDWDQYWRACLADSGLTGLKPFRPTSWHVATTEFSTSQLETFLRVTIDRWGGISVLSDPDIEPMLNGGLALSSRDHGVICEPTCCSDLGDIANWKDAAKYQANEWAMLWIGHPWLSMKYQQPRLLLSAPHESEAPIERWSVNPAELAHAVRIAEAELFRFSKQIESILSNWDHDGDSAWLSLKLAGLSSE